MAVAPVLSMGGITAVGDPLFVDSLETGIAPTSCPEGHESPERTGECLQLDSVPVIGGSSAVKAESCPSLTLQSLKRVEYIQQEVPAVLSVFHHQ